MANFKIRCRHSFHYFTYELLKLFITGVKNGIYNNIITFPAPTISAAIFDALTADLNTKRDLYKKRLGSKGDYLTALSAMMTSLDTLADYVDEIAQNNPDTIILAGYEPTKGAHNNVPAPLQAQNVTITRGTPGTLVIDCDPVAYADSYGLILLAGSPLSDNVIMAGTGQLQVWDNGMAAPLMGPAAPAPGPGMPVLKAVIDLNKNRKKTFINLEIGTTYYAYYWSMNASGVSPLSVVVNKKVLEE